jgi:hypothetical protein
MASDEKLSVLKRKTSHGAQQRDVCGKGDESVDRTDWRRII